MCCPALTESEARGSSDPLGAMARRSQLAIARIELRRHELGFSKYMLPVRIGLEEKFDIKAPNRIVTLLR